jgi:4-amino-4-deoxy-L-arabinose transferase-like glycosyltransferase
VLATNEAGSAVDEAREGDFPAADQPLRRMLRSAPRTLWLILGLWGALLLGASVLWPMSYGYDEASHIDMAYVYSANPFHFYGPGQLHYTRASVAMQQMQPVDPPTKLFSKVPIPPRHQRPSFAQLGGHTFVTGGQPNQMVQHPPLYYWLAAAVLRIPGVSHRAWDLQVWLMRLLSVIFMLPLPVLIWASTVRLLSRPARPRGSHWRLALIAAAIPLTVPNLIRDGSSVTNDSLLILATSAVLYLLSRVLTGDLSRRTAIWIAVWLAIALFTKAFAVILPPIILAAYVFAAWRMGDRLRSRVQVIWQPLGIAAMGGVIGGLWWLRNLIEYGAVEFNGFGPGYDRVLYGPPDNHGTLGHFIPGFFADFANRIWGGVGIPDIPFPGPLIVYGWLSVVLLGVVAALLYRSGPGDRLRALILFAAPVLTVLLVAHASYGTFVHWSKAVRASQGRYLYPVMIVVAALATIGWLRILQPRVRSYLLAVVTAGAVVTNFTVWFMLLRSWYAHGPVPAFHSLLRWSPLPSFFTVLFVLVLPGVFATAAIVGTVLESRRLVRTTAVGPPPGESSLLEPGARYTHRDRSARQIAARRQLGAVVVDGTTPTGSASPYDQHGDDRTTQL